MTYIKSFLITLFFVFFAACSDSKPDKLISSFSNDLNGGTTLATSRVSQMNVYANYDDGESQNITDTLLWSSSDETVATVVNGLIQTFAKVGSVDVTYKTKEKASDGSYFYENSVSFDVKELTLTDITLSQTALSLSVGATKSVTAEGTFEDPISSTTSTQDLTQDCNWSSADVNVSSVSNGVIKGVNEGNTTITASDSNISASLPVEVTKTNYVSLSIYTQENSFNVEQTIELQARALTDNGDTIILQSSEVTWVSSDTSYVTMSQNIATAKAKGDSTITATLVEDTSFSATQLLSVEKDEYLRLFKGDEEVGYPYVASETNATLSTTLGTFTLRAVGMDFTINSIYVRDFSGIDIGSGATYFEGLSVLTLLSADDNVTFELRQDGFQTNLHYFFDVNDSARSSFSQKYEQID